MPVLPVVTVDDIINRANYELRNSTKRQYPDGEIMTYINKCLEMLHEILVGIQSDLVRTGRGTLTTVPGQELYSLTDAGMGDLWTIWSIALPGFTPLEISEEYSRQASGILPGTGVPGEYYLEGENIGLLPIPAREMTYNVIYFPAFVGIEDAESQMPYRNLFNLSVIEAVQLFAKHRNVENPALNADLYQLFHDRALEITRQRQKRTYQQSCKYK